MLLGKGLDPMKPVGFVYSKVYLEHDMGAAHPENPERLQALIGHLESNGLLSELTRIDPEASRGVKQAPFVVLSGVQMPAMLVEIGFITNPGEERQLQSGSGRTAIASALSDAVLEYGRRYDARRGLTSVPARGPR